MAIQVSQMRERSVPLGLVHMMKGQEMPENWKLQFEVMKEGQALTERGISSRRSIDGVNSLILYIV